MSISEKPFAQLTLDFMFKRAFATEKNKHILISLINTFLGEKMEYPLEDILVICTVQTPETEELRGAIFDIHCKDVKENRFIVEMQLAKQTHFLERLLFYICQSITSAAEKGSEYDYSLPRIYTLSFLDFIPKDIGNIGEGNEECIQYISLSNEKYREIVYPYISITLVLLPEFTKTREQCVTIRDWWLFLFKNMHELDEIPPELIELSEKVFSDLFETAKIAMFTKEELEKYRAKMRHWNDSKAILDCAKEDGREAGKAEGIAIGEARGEVRGFEKDRSYIKNLQAQGLSSDEILERFMQKS